MAVPVPNWPVRVTTVSAIPEVGLKSVTARLALPASTVKVALVAAPRAVWIRIPPVVAPVGTTTTSKVGVASRTWPGEPLKVTVLPAGATPNPDPRSCTREFAAPLVGLNDEIDGAIAGTAYTGSVFAPK